MQCLWRSEGSFGASGRLVIGSYELPEVGNEELGSSGREAMLLTQ